MINTLIVQDGARFNQAVCSYLSDTGFRTKSCLLLVVDSLFETISKRQDYSSVVAVRF